MAENIKQKFYNAQSTLLHLIPLMFIITTALIISKDLANGNVSGKYFWFYQSMGIIAALSFIIAIPTSLRARSTRQSPPAEPSTSSDRR